MQNLLGLIGYPLSHSFSKKYFQEKFVKEGIENFNYELFPLSALTDFPALLAKHPNLRGLNVTIPYKEAIISYLDELHPAAQAIGAVNTILLQNNKKIGYNTDYIGFLQSLKNWLAGEKIRQALILGTGGASKAVQTALASLGIAFVLVSHSGKGKAYQDIDAPLMQSCQLIINTSPLGMYPQNETLPDIPYHWLSNRHYVYDLVYNPPETLLLQKAKKQGAKTKNGLEMLYLQAEAAWKIWQGKIVS
ncbi:MAG: shikimate dehydrogenase [Raineya sp.]